MREGNKTFPYVVVLKQRNRRSVEAVGLIAGLIFMLLLVQRLLESDVWYLYLLIGLAGGGMLAQNFLRYRKGKTTQLRPLFLVAGLSLALLPPFQVSALFFLALALLFPAAIRPQEIGFSDDGILFGGLFGKTLKWSELNNVMIRDGMLTMDYKDNRLFQKETDDLDEEEDDEVTEEEFNAYCRERLSSPSV